MEDIVRPRIRNILNEDKIPRLKRFEELEEP